MLGDFKRTIIIPHDHDLHWKIDFLLDSYFLSRYDGYYSATRMLLAKVFAAKVRPP